MLKLIFSSNQVLIYHLQTRIIKWYTRKAN